MKPASKYLFNAVVKFWNQYQAVLPYNLNWQISMGADEERFLAGNPLVLCDVGARGSAPEELTPFFKHLIYHAFEADKEECEHLNRSPHPYKAFSAFPYFIGKKSGRVIFNLYKRRGESSLFKPGKRFKQLFGGDRFAVEKEVEVVSASLDKVYRKEAIDLPDFLKLDTQGSELGILEGAESIVANACMVEVEVEFLEMYEGQPLFHDVLKFMSERGFELLYLNRVFGQRDPVFEGKSRGQLIFGDALFGRREDRLTKFSNARIVKYIILLINYGHIDFAYHLLTLHPAIREEFPALEKIAAGHKHGSKLKRFMLSQLDKLILLLLHARKYNQLSYDSDRSWPVR